MLRLFTLTLAALGILSTAAIAADKPSTIVDVAVANGSFTTLTKLLTEAKLVDTLKGEGPFTVFAPTDAAFAKIPAATLADLQKPENAQKLKDILTYHVVSGKVMAADVKTGEVPTVQGSTLTATVANGAVKVDNANVVTADVPASNGVIHVIDTVIMP